MEWKQYRIPDQKAYRPTARKHSLYSVGNASSALVTYDLLTSSRASYIICCRDFFIPCPENLLAEATTGGTFAQLVAPRVGL